MSEDRDGATPEWWPAEPRRFVWYRTPREQPTRVAGPREAWELARRFLERATTPYGEGRHGLTINANRWTGSRYVDDGWPDEEYPSECTPELFAEAVRLADERFGVPQLRKVGAEAREYEMEEDHLWLVPTERADDVIDYLERAGPCASGTMPPITATFSSMFLLRDLATGEPLPGQGRRFHLGLSSLFVMLSGASTALLGLTLPFTEPDEATADYVVALQEHAPVWLDPRYFYLMTPEAARHGYRRDRLPPTWIGATADGRLRLDASRSGIVPRQVDLPTDEEVAADDPASGYEPFHAAVATVEQALRDHRAAAIVLESSSDANPRFLVEQAVARAELPMGVLEKIRPASGRSRATELREDLPKLAGQPGVLLVEQSPGRRRPTLAELVLEAASRVVEGVPIPDEVRLVFVVEAPPRRGANSAAERAAIARSEGAGTPEQRAFLDRQASRAANNAIKVILVPRASGVAE